jgi:hypothetical protein
MRPASLPLRARGGGGELIYRIEHEPTAGSEKAQRLVRGLSNFLWRPLRQRHGGIHPSPQTDAPAQTAFDQGQIGLALHGIYSQDAIHIEDEQVIHEGRPRSGDDIAKARTRPPQLSTTFPRLVVGDLIPMIDATYRTLADREHRAMAGLSMGSCQTLQTAMHNLDLFAYIGVFSGPTLANEEQVGFRAALAGVFDDVAAFNARVRLFWFGAGTAEARELGFTVLRDKELGPTGIRYTFWQAPGVAHEWLTWRRCLHEFAPQLFRV